MGKICFFCLVGAMESNNLYDILHHSTPYSLQIALQVDWIRWNFVRHSWHDYVVPAIDIYEDSSALLFLQQIKSLALSWVFTLIFVFDIHITAYFFRLFNSFWLLAFAWLFYIEIHGLWNKVLFSWKTSIYQSINLFCRALYLLFKAFVNHQKSESHLNCRLSYGTKFLAISKFFYNNKKKIISRKFIISSSIQSVELSSTSGIDNIIQEGEEIFKENTAVGLPEIPKLIDSAVRKRQGDQRKHSFIVNFINIYINIYTCMWQEWLKINMI